MYSELSGKSPKYEAYFKEQFYNNLEDAQIKADANQELNLGNAYSMGEKAMDCTTDFTCQVGGGEQQKARVSRSGPQ